jgi:hypothetical protein
MKQLQTNIKTLVFIVLLTVFAIVTNAQKVFMVFNATTGSPEELTLVDSNGVKIGYSNFYNRAGVLTMSLMYKNGVPNGQWSKYDDKTGKIKESFIYVDGKLHGERCYYDETGKITHQIIYKHGMRVNFPPSENLWALQGVTTKSDIYPIG